MILTPVTLSNRLFSYYLLLFTAFLVIGWMIFPPLHNAFLQVLYCMYGMIICNSCTKNTGKKLFFSILFFHLISVSFTAFINMEFYNDVLGFDPHDALFYRECGEEYGDKSYVQFFIFLYSVFPTVDDWGYPSLIWLLYHLFGDVGGLILRVMNAIIVAGGSFLLYKLSLNFLSEGYSKIVGALWGIMPYSIVVSAGGTKENFFGFVVIGFFYYLYELYNKKSIYITSMTLLFTIAIFLFRLANGYSAILCFFSIYLIKKKFVQKHFKSILVLTCIVSIVIFPVLLSKMIEQRGFDSDVFSSGNEIKAAEVGGSIGFIVNLISSFIGPIPCFVSNDVDKLQHLTRYSFVPFIKMLGSFYFYYAAWLSYKEKELEFIPILIFCAVNILMIIVAFFGLHVKFQWPHIPLFIIMSIWGYIQYKRHNVNSMYYNMYIAFVLILIFFYNIR